MRALLLICVLASSAGAQQPLRAVHTKPNLFHVLAEPVRYARAHPEEAALDTAIIAGRGFDAGTANWGLAHGKTEGDPLLGSHPSPRTVWAASMSFAAVACTFNFLIGREIDRGEWPTGRGAMEGVSAASVTMSIFASIGNMQPPSAAIAPRLPPIGRVPPAPAPLHVQPGTLAPAKQ